MEEQIDLKLFTVADLKQVFILNQNVDLLSEEVITRTRAIATIHNPSVTDEMAVVSALFVNRKVAAYTYVFPDRLVHPDRLIYWNTVLYVDKQHEGRGYGAIVIGQMVEEYGDAYFDLDAVPASVGNLLFAGLQVDYVDQYYLEQKHVNKSSLRGLCAYVAEKMRMLCVSKVNTLTKLIHNSDYTLRYVNYIDDQTYAFIQSHSEKDLFLRSREMLNWILTNPLAMEAPIPQRVKNDCFFSGTTSLFRRYAVQILRQNRIVGFYIFRVTLNEIYLEYIYIDEEAIQMVYASIAEHILELQKDRFFTADKQLANWLHGFCLFAHLKTYHKSFSHPHNFIWQEGLYPQAGDGDNII